MSNKVQIVSIENMQQRMKDKKNIHMKIRKIVRQVKSAFNDLKEEMKPQDTKTSGK